MENVVFNELLVALPDWSSRLKALSARYPETVTPQPSRKRAPSLSICEDEPVAACAKVLPAGESSQAVTTVVGPHPLKPTPAALAAAAEEKEKLQQQQKKKRESEVPQECPPPPKQMSKMNAKPTPPKAKFSAINGPQIYYDGEAQKALFDCWTTLNAKRGQLRKEMMGIRRKKMMSLPITDYGYSDESEDEDAESKPKETLEEKQARLEEEKRKAEEERIRQEREKKAAEVLEYIDSCLDKAAKGCENAAFLWLKGEACSGHVNFIAGRMQDAVDRIKAEIAKAAEPKPESTGKILPDEGLGDDDEGLGDDVYMEDAGQPQTIKVDQRPEQRIPRPVRRAGGFVA